jgi:hypothetical protein
MIEQPKEEEFITISKQVAANGSTMAKKPIFASAIKQETESLTEIKVESYRSPKAPSISESVQESSV